MSQNVEEGKQISIKVVYEGALRVFLDKDYHYGYFISREELSGILPEHNIQEVSETHELNGCVSVAEANAIVKAGMTPFAKQFFS